MTWYRIFWPQQNGTVLRANNVESRGPSRLEEARLEIDQERLRNEKKARTDDELRWRKDRKWTITLTLATILLAIVPTFLSWLTYQQLKRQISDAADQSTTAQRPWLKPEVTLSKPMSVWANKDGSFKIFLPALVAAKNVGHSPALDYGFGGSRDESMPFSQNGWDNICEIANMNAKVAIFDSVIFPDSSSESFVFGGEFDNVVANKDVTPHLPNGELVSQVGFTPLRLRLCFRYRMDNHVFRTTAQYDVRISYPNYEGFNSYVELTPGIIQPGQVHINLINLNVYQD